MKLLIVFAAPTPVDCNHLTIELDGTDGNRTSDTVRPGSIVGMPCS